MKRTVLHGHWLIMVCNAFWQVENKRRSIVSAHQIAFYIIYATTNFCAVLLFIHVCLSTFMLLIFYFSLPHNTLNFYQCTASGYCYFPLHSSRLYFRLTNCVYVWVLSSTKTLQAVANIVYFAALCQRWMCYKLSWFFPSFPFSSSNVFMHVQYTIFVHVRKNFPTNFLRAFLCSV